MWSELVERFLGRQSQRRRPSSDSVLGNLVPVDSGWTATVQVEGQPLEFTIGGKTEPDAALLAHARHIASDFEAFKRQVRSCIETESSDYPANVQTELARLVIEHVSLCWPDRPDDGMIYFRGTESDVGLWRCDYIAREPCGLGCDT